MEFITNNLAVILTLVVFVGLVSLMARRLFSALKQWLEENL